MLDAHELLEEVGHVDGQLGTTVDHVHRPVRGDVLLKDLCLLDDGNHVAGGEPQLVGPHQQLERPLVDTNWRLIFLNHFVGKLRLVLVGLCEDR